MLEKLRRAECPLMGRTGAIQEALANCRFPPIAEIQSCIEVIYINKNKGKTAGQPGSPVFHTRFLRI
jgi:hypothetical protein